MKQFLPSDAKDKVLTQWRSLRMQPQGTMQRYIDKFWELHLKATVYKKIDFAKQKQQFCVDLSEEVSEYVNSQRPKTILAVIHHTIVASKLHFQGGKKINQPTEGKHQGENKGKPHSTSNATKASNNNANANNKGKGKDKVYKGKSRLSPEEVERYRKENKCFKCMSTWACIMCMSQKG